MARSIFIFVLNPRFFEIIKHGLVASAGGALVDLPRELFKRFAESRGYF